MPLIMPWITGSSPLTRGKFSDAQTKLSRDRLIPAHAGKMVQWFRAWSRAAAHPRSRGENHRRSAPNGIKSGSSPLTRGKYVRALERELSRGLIPAHAGKIRSSARTNSTTGAHPRSRGENLEHGLDSPGGLGSSPLTRGKFQERRVLRQRARLIPAHAGKIDHLHLGDASGGAHPRSRGENTTWPTTAGRHPGSSPLTRGKYLMST